MIKLEDESQIIINVGVNDRFIAISSYSLGFSRDTILLILEKKFASWFKCKMIWVKSKIR